MSRESENFDVQPGYETDVMQDPAYILWHTEREAESDYSHGIALTEGLRKLTARGASPTELTAYTSAYNAEGVRAVARGAGIPFRTPYVIEAACVFCGTATAMVGANACGGCAENIRRTNEWDF